MYAGWIFGQPPTYTQYRDRVTVAATVCGELPPSLRTYGTSRLASTSG